MNTLCIYHGKCADGFASAWVVRRYFGNNVEFHAGVYQEPPPDVTGRDVVIVDFSYKRPVLEEMMSKAKSLLILDHHKSAAGDLAFLPSAGDDYSEFHGDVAAACASEDLPHAASVFDMGRSGARITWDYFFPKEAPPRLLLHVEDRDLWKFALPNTREIQACVFSHAYDFAVWDELMTSDLTKLAVEGTAIERKHFRDIEELLDVTTRTLTIAGHTVKVANLPYIFSSDAAHKLGIDAPFGACYWDTPEGRVFSLRSSDDGIDVSEVAKKYGGGGHAHASGFRVSFDQAKTFEVN